MLESAAERLAIRMKQINPEETASVAVMKYALIGLFHNGIIVLTALSAGVIFGHLLSTLLAIVCFMALRFVSGGFHFQSSLACFLFSSIVFIVIPWIPASGPWLMALNTCSFLLALIFSPSNIEQHIRVHKKHFVWFKAASVFIVACNFFILSPVTTWALFAQSLSLVHFRRRGDQNVQT